MPRREWSILPKSECLNERTQEPLRQALSMPQGDTSQRAVETSGGTKHNHNMWDRSRNEGTTSSGYMLVIWYGMVDTGGWNTKSPPSGSLPIRALVLTVQVTMRG
jgi:hypothetical protein